MSAVFASRLDSVAISSSTIMLFLLSAVLLTYLHISHSIRGLATPGTVVRGRTFSVAQILGFGTRLRLNVR